LVDADELACAADQLQIMSTAQKPVIVLVRDLMFAGRIRATARAANAEITLLRDMQQLAVHSSHRLIVDLGESGALEAAVAWKGEHGGEVVGFVAHVDAAMIEKAKAVGIDHVLSRGQFSADVERWLG
jgi:hypothetical protein